MRYVQRDPTGRVIGHYAQPQLGTSRNRATGEVLEAYATEALPDDHPDIVGFHARMREEGRRAKEAAGPGFQETVLQELVRLRERLLAAEARLAALERGPR